MRRVRLVLIRPHPPFDAARHGIDGNPAEEFQLAAGRVVRGVDAVDERLQIRRIVLAADLELERSDLPEIGRVFVLVDRRADLAQVAVQLGLASAPRGHLRERHDRGGENHDDRRDDEELDERVA